MSDPQPVLKNAAVTAFVVLFLTELTEVTSYFDWWSPSADDILMWAKLAGLVVGVALLVQAWFVHRRVTPNEKVALTVTDVALLEAADDPQSKHGMDLLRDIAQVERDRVPPTY